MNVLAFDGRLGASGDMLLGTLLDLGADPAVLEPIAEHLDVSYEIADVEKCGIAATSVTVTLDEAHPGGDAEEESGNDADAESKHEGRHEHDHDHSGAAHTHEHHDEGHSHHGTEAEGQGPHRSYREVIDLVESMGLSSTVETEATAIFERLGRAEAAVHGTELDSTTFHEVGADDAIADITGVAALLADLDIDRVVTTPLSTGGGTVEMSHGEYPIPGPAVVEIASEADWSVQGGPVDSELLTPTGAAILAEVAEGVDSLPTLDVDATGYGAGGYDLDPHANVLRGILGTTTGALAREPIVVLETNLDDATPETLGSLQETLSGVGAKDVTIVPTTMKKSRPGHLVKVIVAPEDEQRLARALAEETGTLGVRAASAGHRWTAQRRIETVTIEVGGEEFEIDVKVASDEDGTVYDVSAEHDDVMAIAEGTDEPVRRIRQQAEYALRSEREFE
jgi:hypothetical protein